MYIYICIYACVYIYMYMHVYIYIYMFFHSHGSKVGITYCSINVDGLYLFLHLMII